LLDALIPGLEYLEKLDKNDPKFSFKDMTKAIKEGADYAKTLKSTKGKGAYMGVKVVGIADPDCELIVFIF